MSMTFDFFKFVNGGVGLLLLVAATAFSGEETTPAEQGPSNKIKWSTASEVDNFGFDVYRSEHEDGPFEKINSSPILGAGTSDEPQHYQYTDESIEYGRQYYYYVESISMDSLREQFTPVFPAPIKTAPTKKP